MKTPSHSIVEGQLAIDLPLVLGVPLKQPQLAVSEIARLGLGIGIEITENRVGVCKVCVACS